jgi:hypothetical protein
MQETLKDKLPEQPTAWLVEEFNIHGELVWEVLLKFRPTEISWIRDLPNKKHYLVITELHRKKESAEKITGIKSYRESTKRLMEAYGGL